MLRFQGELLVSQFSVNAWTFWQLTFSKSTLRKGGGWQFQGGGGSHLTVALNNSVALSDSNTGK